MERRDSGGASPPPPSRDATEEVLHEPQWRASHSFGQAITKVIRANAARYRENGQPARPQNPSYFSNRSMIVRQVFKNAQTCHVVEAFRREREELYVRSAETYAEIFSKALPREGQHLAGKVNSDDLKIPGSERLDDATRCTANVQHLSAFLCQRPHHDRKLRSEALLMLPFVRVEFGLALEKIVRFLLPLAGITQ